jgi:Flp pilus assembly pilin Flp
MHPPARRAPRTPRTRCEAGASAVEYALLVAAVAVVLVAVLVGIGSIVQDAIHRGDDCVTSRGTSPSCPTTPSR